MSTNFQHHTHLLFSSRVSLSARKKITQGAVSCIFSIPLFADSYEETTKKCIIAARCLEKNISLNSFSVRFDVVEHKHRRDCIFYIWPVAKQTKNKNSSALARKNIPAISSMWQEWHRGVSKIFSTQLSKRERDKQYEALRTFIAAKVRKTSTHKLFLNLDQSCGQSIRKESAFLLQFALSTQGDYRQYGQYLKKEHDPVVLNEYAKTLLALVSTFSVAPALLTQFLSAPSIPLNEKGLLLLGEEIKKGEILIEHRKIWNEVIRLSEIPIPLVAQIARRLLAHQRPAR